MGRALVIILLVAGVIIGGLLVLRGSARTGMPDADVLARAQRRAREQRAKDDER
jgi:hypothetical protein